MIPNTGTQNEYDPEDISILIIKFENLWFHYKEDFGGYNTSLVGENDRTADMSSCSWCFFMH